MHPIKFNGHNVEFAKDQPEYRTMPAYVGPTPEGTVISCWRLSLRERLKLLITGRMWHTQLTFGAKPSPVKLEVDSPWFKGEELTR